MSPARIGAIVVAAWLVSPQGAAAQQPTAPSQPTAAQPAPGRSGEWAALPRMIIERQFAGPLQDTVIQRLRDPVDGTICYLYLPISAPHTPATASGFVQYGPNAIGSINCLPARPTIPAARKP